MRILLAEDDRRLASELAFLLRRDNFVVDVADNGPDVTHLGRSEDYDAVVLDLGLPQQDGLSVLDDWRRSGCQVPVLILTARDTWSDKAAGFQGGADDYLTKPFLPAEVIARLRALIRRARGHAAGRIKCGGLEYDCHTGDFAQHGEPCRLTAFEARILAVLMLRKNRVVSRSALAEHVYDQDADVSFQSLEVVIGRIRRKIGGEMIETVRGMGYCLREPLH